VTPHQQGSGATVDEWFRLLAQVRAAGKDAVLGYDSPQVFVRACLS